MIDEPLYFIHTLYIHTENRHVTSLYQKKIMKRTSLFFSSALPLSRRSLSSTGDGSNNFTLTVSFFSMFSFSLLVFSFSLTVSTMFTIPVSAVVPYHIPIASDSPHSPSSTTTNTTVDRRHRSICEGQWGCIFF